MNGGRRARFLRTLHGRWRFAVIVTRGFRAEIVFCIVAIALSGWLIQHFHPNKGEPLGTLRALHCALAMLTLQSELDFPEPWPAGSPMTLGVRVVQALWFVLPVMGVTVVAETLVRLGVTIFNREHNSKEWNVAVAQTMKDHTVVIGFGRIGYRVVGQLAPRDSRIVVVENNPKEEFRDILEKYDIPLIEGDARRDDVLDSTGIKHARTLLCLTNEDLVNIECGLNARERNPTVKVILRMFDDHLAERIERAFDFQAVFSTTALAAPSFAAAVWNQKILHSMSVGESHLHLARFDVVSGSPLVGMTIAQVEARHAVNILLHQRAGESDLLPAAGNVIGPRDTLFLVGRLEGVDAFDRLAGGVRTTRRSWGRWRVADEDARAVLSRKIENYYDELGDGVDRAERYQARAKARALALLDARPGMKILEIGVGTGALLSRVVQKTGDPRSVVGLDLAGGVLRRAQVRLAAQPHGSPPLVRATTTRLPFADETFDRVLATYLLDLLEEEDVLLALSEMRRVSKQGALIVCAGLTKRGASPQARLVASLYSVTRRFQPLWTGGVRPIDLEPLARRAGLRVAAREVVEQKGRASEVVCLSR
ncbi:MAG TPA: NAD-binding protein [Planctomycetota bacterium]|nr:NAD-binding protein [Planctomycetota bacterium]